YATEIIPITTRGDTLLDVAISKIGSKGVFTEEIEQGLFDGSIDIAVHSAKDLSSTLPDDLELIAFTEREKPNDVVISLDPSFNLKTGSPVVGTSSTRRVAFLHHFYPNVNIVPARGNLQTRLQKMKDGNFNALILAYAGVHRSGYEEFIVEEIETSYFVPAVGQGSIAVECHRKLDYAKKEAVAQWVNDATTEVCVRTERAYLRAIEGGCSIPAFGYARVDGDLITLKAGIISLDGKKIVKVKRSGSLSEGKAIGQAVAAEVLSQGGKEILEEIRNNL
ncbi:MAG TPA: hydroxymethylbilane synthase, partial [Cyclobacteriaceae bacterium]|nr:hydroxymethylbilane synthase [Cyclobacteriaceae bacterium]